VADAACPADFVEPATTICNPGSGDICDPDESCLGTPGAACPDDTIAPATTICRDSAGVCDVPDSCTGVADEACGPDLKEDCSFVTDSSLCPFDVNPDKGVCVDDATGLPTQTSCDLADGDPGCPDGTTCEQSREFRLLYPPYMQDWEAYKLVASNPGQYFYNLVVEGTANTTVPVDISIAYPFVTQGAMPVHVYDAVELQFDQDGCFLPPEVALAAFDQQIDIGDYYLPGGVNLDLTCDGGRICGPDGSGACAFTVNVALPQSGQAYVNVHMDYGLKGQDLDANVCEDGFLDRYDREQTPPDPDFGGWDALVNTPTEDGPVALANCKTYEFEHVCRECDDQTPMGDQVTSLNEFKKVAGVMGLAQGAAESPLVGAEVIVYRNSTNLIVKTATTDEDGYYLAEYKHKGKPDDYTIILTETGSSQVITLRGNGWAEVNFLDGTVEGTWVGAGGGGGKRH
jgi:hypothetical protein